MFGYLISKGVVTLILSCLIHFVKSDVPCRGRYKIHNIGLHETPTINFYIIHREWINENVS